MQYIIEFESFSLSDPQNPAISPCLEYSLGYGRGGNESGQLAT